MSAPDIILKPSHIAGYYGTIMASRVISLAVPRGRHDGPSADVLHHATVAGPAVLAHLLHRRRRRAAQLAAGLGVELLQKVMRQFRNILDPFAQRRH